MLDLDKFKQINDNHGHDVGDEVLKEFAQRLKTVLRSHDWIARIGGEDFVVWLPNVSPLRAIQVAERIRMQTENAQISVDQSTIRYTVSIGLHVVKNEKPSLFESWLKSADQLLYRAKTEGRNRVVCGESI